MKHVSKMLLFPLAALFASNAWAENWREVGTTVDLVWWEVDVDSIESVAGDHRVREALFRLTDQTGRPTLPLSVAPKRLGPTRRTLQRYVVDCRAGRARLLSVSAPARVSLAPAEASAFEKPRNGSILQDAVASACGRFSPYGQPPLR